MPRLAILLIGLLAIAVPPAAPPFPGDLRPTPTGDVWVEMVPAGAGLPREGIGRGIIEAPPERVFRALADIAHWPEWMPFLKRSDARPQGDGSVLSQQTMALPSPLSERRYSVRFTQGLETGPEGKTWVIRWSLVPGSGNLAGLRGSWRLTALGTARTLGVCRLFTDPGGLTPHFAVDRGTAQSLPWIFHGLRQQVRRSRYDGP
ncbi:MAG TPA: SRPBCC family protein [Thermoanaerobaculia bacterium]|nr:SRPBCC family protein [Thermoanaerobaculia bacterium]